MFDLNRMEMRHKPFPVGVLSDVFDPGIYRELAETYPEPTSMRLYKSADDALATKYNWNETASAEPVVAFLKENQRWSELWKHLRSSAFINHTLEALKNKGVNVTRWRADDAGKLARLLSATKKYRKEGPVAYSEYIEQVCSKRLTAKLEFSALPGQQGGLRPHSDSPHKLITCVFAFPREGEWTDDFGGGTSFVEPRDENGYYNRLNRTLDFDEVSVIETVPYRPNQVMVFVKTFNSWHAVFPTHAPRADIWRKTITVNIMVNRTH